MTELDDLIHEQRVEQRYGSVQYREGHVVLSLDAFPRSDIGDAESIQTWWKRSENRNFLHKRTKTMRTGCATHGFEFWTLYDRPTLGGNTGHCQVCRKEKWRQAYARRTQRLDPRAAQGPDAGSVPAS